MLSRIRIRGFKSFADPIAIDLVPGVNVVVGPNGSGKSNVVEAVLWALGEQRPARLRAGSMGEVLYSGGADRSRAAFADVGLTLSADEAGLDPLEVSRRLTAAGDSGYRLGGVDCRLLDVQEAFAGRGLGPESLAVVRQGQVEGVCAAAPATLRGMIDEAAGIAHGRRRRRRTEGRLAQIDDRLEQARVQRDELADRLRRLERQSRAAERAAALEQEIAATKAQLERARAAALVAAAELAGAELAERRSERAQAEQEAATARSAAASAQEQAATARARAGSHQELERALASAGDRCEARYEVAADRVAAAESSRDAVAEAAAAREELRAAADAAELTATAAAVALERVEQEVLERDAHATAERSAAAERHADAARARAAAADAERRKGAAADRKRRLDESRATLDARLAQAAGGSRPADPERAARREEIASRRAAAWQAREADAAARTADVDAQLEVAVERARAATTTVSALEARGGAVAGIGSGLDVEPGLEDAVAAALGDVIDAHPVADLREAARVLASGARAAVLPRTRPSAPEGGLTHAVRDVAPESAPHVHELLGSARLVERLEDAPADGGADLYVTRDGIVYRPADGLVRRLGGEWASSARADRARDEAGLAHEGVARARESAEQARLALEDAGRRRRAADRSAARASERLVEERARSLARAEETRDLEAQLETMARELEAAETELGSAGAELEQATAAVAECERGAEEADASATTAVAAARAAGAARDSARADEAAARRAHADADERAARSEAAASALGVTIDLERLRAGVVALAEIGDALRDQGRARRAGTERLLAEAESAADDARRAAGARDELDARLGRAREAEAVAAERERAARELTEGLEDPGEGEETDLEPTDLEARLGQLEGARARIGAVNALAGEEREVLEAEATELGEQIDDLERASEGLRERVAGLDARVEEAFEETFGQLQDRFAESVAALFPGGAGRLREVTADGEDEPGIEIDVVPAGKRPRPLRLMSGGERSLIALAFCLALAQTRPAPVYVLDEVDAALDDPNLRRFLALVETLASDTQFVLVTHQQPTVESAQAVFGVTMGADGASQLLSRRLPDAAENDEPRRRLRAVAGGRA